VICTSEFACYGKLPSVGDFISRNMDYSQAQIIDAWLEAGLSALIKTDENWLDFYLSAPVWCFNLPERVWGDGPINGLVMPSVDRVGRYFPFVVLLPSVSNSSSDKLMISLLYLSERLPQLLQGNILPDQILPFLNALYEEVNFYNPLGDDVFIEDSKEPCEWWFRHSSKKLGKLNYPLVPDDSLFVHLFGTKNEG
jgi:type VI secretion system ImpM family protein